MTVTPAEVTSVEAAAELRIRVWDGFTRLTHWALVVTFACSWWSAHYHYMDYHRYSGYVLLGVLVFRVYWGFVGSTTARFAQFVKNPRAVWRYLQTPRRPNNATPIPNSEPSAYGLQPTAYFPIGHTPLGALSVLALLALLLTQVGLGLFAVDVDGLESGPLSYLIDFDTGRACAKAHAVVFNVLLTFVVLHVAAIAFYGLVRRDNLIRPMITGWKALAHHYQRHQLQPLPIAQIMFAPWWAALLGIVLAVGVVWSVV